jgi:hypothetical protein
MTDLCWNGKEDKNSDESETTMAVVVEQLWN